MEWFFAEKDSHLDHKLAENRALKLRILNKNIQDGNSNINEDQPLISSAVSEFKLSSTYSDISYSSPTAAWYLRHLKITILFFCFICIFIIPFLFTFMRSGLHSGFWSFTTVGNFPSNEYLPSYLLWVTVAFGAVIVVFYVIEISYENRFIGATTSKVCSASDYTVKVSCPTKVTQTEQLRKHFEKYGEVACVAIHFNPNDLRSLKTIKQKHIALNEIECQLPDIPKKDLVKLQDELQKSTKNHANVAYVTFSNHQSLHSCLYSLNSRLDVWFSRLFASYKGLDNFIFSFCPVEQAPEPDDIIFENLGYGKWSKFWRAYIGGLAIMFTVAIGSILITELVSFQITLEVEEHHTMVNYITIIMISAALSVVNFVTRWICCFGASLLKPIRYTHLIMWRFALMVVLQIINVSLVFNFAYTTVLAKSNIGFLTREWFQKTSRPMIMVFVTTILISCFNVIIGPGNIVKKKVLVKFARNQRQLNAACEPPDFNIDQLLSIISMLVFVAVLYWPVFPLLLPLLCICLLLKYWVDKYVILRRYKIARSIFLIPLSMLAREVVFMAVCAQLIFYSTCVRSLNSETGNYEGTMYTTEVVMVAGIFSFSCEILRLVYIFVVVILRRVPNLKPNAKPLDPTLLSYVAPNISIKDLNVESPLPSVLLPNGDRRCANSVYWINPTICFGEEFI